LDSIHGEKSKRNSKEFSLIGSGAAIASQYNKSKTEREVIDAITPPSNSVKSNK
jgi:hypothetical protein